MNEAYHQVTMSPIPEKRGDTAGSDGAQLQLSEVALMQRDMAADRGKIMGSTSHESTDRSSSSLAKRRDSLDRLACDSLSEDDDEEGHDDLDSDSARPPAAKKKKVVGEKKREIKNAREKERSSRIAKQIDELRDMLTGCGVVVPKGTKSSVLTEVATYIRILQQQQVRSEFDRNLLIQQVQMIGGGAHGPEAAAAIRHAAAQNGVLSLGCFDGVQPVKQDVVSAGVVPSTSISNEPVGSMTNAVDSTDYKSIFNASGVGMAIASMGGAFMDCNSLFSRLSNYSKQELCALTIFNLTARNELQRSFDLISRMITPMVDGGEEPPRQVVLRGAINQRSDLGMSISLVKGDNGIAKCFCVTLVKNPSSPFETGKPTPVSFESVIPEPSGETTGKDSSFLAIRPNPAFTYG